MILVRRKHSREEVVGLEHYRRRFILPDNWLKCFETDVVDVILPVPLCVVPNLEANYLFRHDERPWNIMLDILKEQSRVFEKAQQFFKTTGCYSPCNMLITRREILNELCEWMFPILLRTVEETGKLEDKYQNRYGGFLAERLSSFFFYDKESEYKIVYADKTFLD